MKNHQLFILGIDGATFDLLDPWIEQGKLPHFAQIINKGCRGTLTSTMPPISCLAWPSMVTGMNPAKHGIFDWLEVTKNEKAIALPVSSKNRRVPALWNLLSAEGRRVGIFNVPMTYPPEKVGGFMVSGMDSPLAERASTYPQELAAQLHEVCNPYVLDVYHVEDGDLELYFRRMDQMMTSRKEAIFYLIDHYPWDFFMAVFVFADRLQHKFWSLWDSSHPLYNSELAQRYGHKLLEYYQQTDEILGELMHKFKDEVNLLVVSDHGFGPTYKAFSVNNFLRQIGVLHLEAPANNVTPLWKKLLPTKIKHTSKQILEAVREKPLQRFTDVAFPTNLKISFSQTKAFTLSNAGHVHINLRGKYDQGIVEAGKEYEDLRNYIIQELQSLKDPETQEPVIGEIYKKEEIYWGEYLELAPDIVFQTRGREYSIVETNNYLNDYNDHRIIKTWPSMPQGDHRMNGILLAYGPDITEGAEVDGAHITDVAPTALHLLSSPVSPPMDGKVLLSLLKEEFKHQRPVIYGQDKEQKVSAVDSKPTYSPQEAEEIQRRLKGMGYLS